MQTSGPKCATIKVRCRLRIAHEQTYCVLARCSNKGVMRPLQKRLSLSPAAKDISRLTVCANLSSVTRKAAPSLDLYGIYFRDPPPQIIAAIPLKPPPRIGANNPTFLFPVRERLPALDAKIIELWVRLVADAGFGKPVSGKLVPAVVAVSSLEDAHREHLRRRELWPKTRHEALAGLRNDLILIIALHAIIHDDRIANSIHLCAPLGLP